MPYIPKERRSINKPENAGDLNYLITSLCHDYLKQNGLSYAELNAIVGALECAKLEFYRRIAAPYEDKKIEENGDLDCLKE